LRRRVGAGTLIGDAGTIGGDTGTLGGDAGSLGGDWSGNCAVGSAVGAGAGGTVLVG
jgi:hypothetical protein